MRRKLLALPWADRRLLVEAAWRLLAARGAAAWTPRAALAGPRHAATALADPPDPTTTERVAWAVRAVACRLPAGFRGCLPQALAVSAMLRRRGIPARLVIGVRRAPASTPLQAHAWVESGGRVIVGAVHDLPSYVPLEAPPPAAVASAARHG